MAKILKKDTEHLTPQQASSQIHCLTMISQQRITTPITPKTGIKLLMLWRR